MADPIYDKDKQPLKDQERNPDDPKAAKWSGDDDNYGTKYGGDYGSDKPKEKEPDPYQTKWGGDYGSDEKDKLGKGYTGEGDDKGNTFINRFSGIGFGKGRAKKLLLTAIGGSVVALIIAGLLGILGAFKLDHIMSNVDARVFARMQGVEDRRSRRWMQSYLEMRLADLGDGDRTNVDEHNNKFFRAEKVQRGNPMFNWYRTMRTSNFERDIFEKHGFKFVSVFTADGKVRPGKIIMNGKTLQDLKISGEDWSGLENGNTKTLQRYSQLVDVENFDHDGQARKAIRQMVNKDIPAWHIFQRRQIRKDIQNQIGVRDWRFFEKTRQKVHEKKIDIRNRILSKAIPAKFAGGQILRCLFGVDKCTYSADTSDPVNQESGVDNNGKGEVKNKGTKKGEKPIDEFETDTEEDGSPVQDEDGNTTDKNGDRLTKPKTADFNTISDDAAKIAARLGTKLGTSFSALGAVVNITGTLEMLSQINQAIPQIAKMAIIAKTAQAMGLFQVFETARDQARSGQLDGQEYGEFMKVLNNPTASEAWFNVVQGKDGVPKNTKPTKADYCKDGYTPKETDFHYACDDKKIGSGGNAAGVAKKYDETIGKVIKPIVEAYDKVKAVPIIGSLIGAVNAVLGVVSQAISAVVVNVFSTIGVDIKGALKYIMGKLAALLGAGPIIDGFEKAGEFVNWIIQGGAATAESTMRASGAAKTTEQSKAENVITLNMHRQYEQESSTVFSRYLALSNPDSLAAKSVFALSNFKLSSVANIFTYPKTLFANIAAPFNGQANAVVLDDGYRASKFAGIPTHDFPKQCFDLKPSPFQQPLQDDSGVIATNVMQVLAAEGVAVSDEDKTALNSWDTQTDNVAFWALVYKIIRADKDKAEKADEIAESIYNCNLLDTRIRGALGFPYGYTDDKGLEETSAATGASNTSSSAPGACPTLNGYQPSSAECHWLAYIYQSVLPLLPADAPGGPPAMAARVSWWALREQILQYEKPENPVGSSNCGVDKNGNSVGNDYRTFTDVCQVNEWQLGIAGVHYFESGVKAKALQLHPGKTVKDIITQVAADAEHPGDTTAINAPEGSRLQISLLLRDPATGFVFEDGTIRSQCLVPNPSSGSGCIGDSYTPAKELAFTRAIVDIVIGQLTDYFKGSGGSNTTAPSGNLQALAKQVLANQNVSYPLDAVSPNGSTRQILQDIANGQKARVTCPYETTRFPNPIDLNPNILKAILEYATNTRIGVNALTDKCHGTPGQSQSNHYYGKAVDFECGGVQFDVTKFDAIASKYGGARNEETCSADQHWHYNFLGT